MKLADLTWEEVQKYLKKNDGIIIPSGMTEQHSTHLPLNADTLVAEYICDYLSRKTGLLVAPTINYGIGLPCDKFYAGSTSIQHKALEKTLSSLMNWWEYQGFKKFFIVSAHGDFFHIKILKRACGENALKWIKSILSKHNASYLFVWFFIVSCLSINLNAITELRKILFLEGYDKTKSN